MELASLVPHCDLALLLRHLLAFLARLGEADGDGLLRVRHLLAAAAALQRSSYWVTSSRLLSLSSTTSLLTISLQLSLLP